MIQSNFIFKNGGYQVGSAPSAASVLARPLNPRKDGVFGLLGLAAQSNQSPTSKLSVVLESEVCSLSVRYRIRPRFLGL